MVIIYRKSDLKCVGVVSDNMTIEQEITLNVIPNFGGIIDDYDSIQTEKKYFHLERVNGVVTIVKNEPPPEPSEPSEIDLLRLEQAQANAELFELVLMLTGGV